MTVQRGLGMILALALGLGCAGGASAETAGPADAVFALDFPDELDGAVDLPSDPEQTGPAVSGVIFASVTQAAPDTVNTSHRLSCDSKMARLLDDPAARGVLQRRIPDVVSSPRIVMARGITLKQLSRFRQTGITSADLAAIDQDLASASELRP